MGLAEEGYIHEEDYKEYVEFCSIEHLKRIFSDGSQYASLQYRRVIDGEYRWISMEILRSTEYREDNQKHVRDINDDYIKLLQMAMSHTLDSVGIVSANVSQGICLSFAGKKEELEGREGVTLEMISKMIPVDELRKNFCQKFSQKNMLTFHEGKTDRYGISKEAQVSVR